MFVSQAEEIFDVPKLKNIVIDGRADDWKNKGFEVDILSFFENKIIPISDFDPSFKLGWNKEGLLILMEIYDDKICEDDGLNMWKKDSIELYLGKTYKKELFWYKALIGPGIDPEYSKVRTHFFDHRNIKKTKTELTIKAAQSKISGGYIVEMMLPWKNLEISAKTNNKFKFQLYVNDADGKGYPEEWLTSYWYPSDNTNQDCSAMHSIRLSHKSSPPVKLAVSVNYEKFRWAKIYVIGTAKIKKGEITLNEGNRSVAKGKFIIKNGRPIVNFTLPMPKPGKKIPDLEFRINNKKVQDIRLPSYAKARMRAFIDAEFSFYDYCFKGTDFPSCDFKNSTYVEDMIGPYKIETTFYNAKGEPVKKANKPGRYGAVIEIHRQDGQINRRFRTLFKIPEEMKENWWDTKVKASVNLPEGLGIDTEIMKAQSDVINNYLRWRLAESLRDGTGTVLITGLYENSQSKNKDTMKVNPGWRERQWWVNFKRKFYGLDKIHKKSFVCPKPIKGKPAPIVRVGTLEEAGIKKETVEKIDKIFKEWARESKEPFGVCIVRHGVIAIHKAYGQYNEKPMTLNTKTWMASITKLMSATLMMEFVDQGLVGLDDRIDKHLPAFRNIKVKTPLTIRHLYTHTNGLWGHWGDEVNDFEEVISDFYPYLETGQRFEYNGAGYALGGKIMEMISGEAMPYFNKKHLLDPLGCSNTIFQGTSSDTMSVPLDMAKFGQMLLNKGAYGKWKFFSEKTFEKMKPRPLTKLLGPGTNGIWGIGITGRGKKIFFGHGAASSAILRIFPDADMVVVQTRDQAGKNFKKNFKKFQNVIYEDIVYKKKKD
jgi:CubicO group peptidase (beta-lactamase class C family)